MATDWEKTVYSSNVSTVAYDREEKALYVTFQEGGRYVYQNVPEELAENLANAPSVGSMLRNEIQPYYNYSKA